MVLIIGDSGESYLSHAFSDAWMIEKELLDEGVGQELEGFICNLTLDIFI
ncbi:MAG: hypothetical protein R3B65_03525 [Candidatus Paceibacterota bacterium]